MKLMVSLILLFAIQKAKSQEPQLTDLRNLYHKAAASEQAFNDLTASLSSVNGKSAPILVCYKGAAQMIAAKYQINPFSKLNSFNKGKKMIEAAITRNPNCIEMRFLRLSIQKNLPSFLGYNNNIVGDKNFLIKTVNTSIDVDLKERVINYLVAQKYSTAEELKNI